MKFFPIIYVRGYAMTEKEMDETSADPFNGFNLGSTVYRASVDKENSSKKFMFESPLIRLMKDHNYSDVYSNGQDILELDDDIKNFSAKSIIIHRYYDPTSTILGNGSKPDIEVFANKLSELILRVRDLVCANKENSMSFKNFKCYLVAHSMGGLICRAFIQNPKLGNEQAKKAIDKIFTYATPHNGIDLGGMNAPNLNVAGVNTFNRKFMADYLNLRSLYTKSERVDWLPEEVFSSERFFCMVGTNRNDYDVLSGLSRTFAGHGSDGLVRIENASVWGVKSNGEVSVPSATAYTNRSHSGFFGIVNSEDAYQNLTRFLFGDVRVDIWLDIEDIKLPTDIKDKKVNALYQFEIDVAPKGMRWFLTQRRRVDDSAACRTYQELKYPAEYKDQHIYLSTAFLSKAERVDNTDPSLSYLLNLNISALEYEIDHKFWRDGHFEGSSLFQSQLIAKIITPSSGGLNDWNVKFYFGNNEAKFNYKQLENNKIQIELPFDTEGEPGVKGRIRFIISTWNEEV